MLFLSGCSGGKKTEVSGTVTLADGKPLPSGKIRFIPTEKKGKTVDGDIEDGKFTVKNVPLGECRVSINTEHLNVDDQIKTTEATIASQGKGAVGAPEMEKYANELKEKLAALKADKAKYRPIPKKYTDDKSSPLTITVKKDEPIEIKLDAK